MNSRSKLFRRFHLGARIKSLTSAIIIEEHGSLRNFCKKAGISISALSKALSPSVAYLSGTVEQVLLEHGRLNNVLRFEYALRERRTTPEKFFTRSGWTQETIINVLRGEYWNHMILRELQKALVIEIIPDNINDLKIPIKAEANREKKAQRTRKINLQRERERLKKWEKRLVGELKDVRGRIATLGAQS